MKQDHSTGISSTISEASEDSINDKNQHGDRLSYRAAISSWAEEDEGETVC